MPNEAPVFGEEHFTIDISKGLFLSPTPDAIPDGYNQVNQNLIKNDRNHWETRKGLQDLDSASFVADASLQTLSNPVTNPIPELRKETSCRFFFLYGGNSLPQAIMAYIDSSSAIKLFHHTGRKGGSDTVESQTQGISGGTAIADMAQYIDRIYAARIAAGPTVNIDQVSNFKYDGTTPALTITNKVTGLAYPANNTAAIPVLVSYANRLFCAVANRVYYTDIPAPGGYPETWNGSTNFFDLPADNTGIPLIYNMINLNGLLYMFTDKGVFVLNARGPTANWAQNFVSDAVKIFSKHSVALVSGLFIMTDRKKLWSFDGARVGQLGQQISYVFDIYNSFSVTPYERGFLLSCRYFVASSGNWINSDPVGSNTAVWPNSRTFYFDGAVWSELLTSTLASNIDVITGATAKNKTGKDTENLSIIGYRSSANAVGFAYLERSQFRDTLGGSNIAITSKLETNDIMPGIESQYIAIKTGRVRVFSLITPVVVKTYKNGSSAALNTLTKTVTSQADNNYRIGFTGTEISTRMSVEVSATPGSPATIFNTDLPDSVPCFEIKEIIVVGDRNVRESTEGIES